MARGIIIFLCLVFIPISAYAMPPVAVAVAGAALSGVTFATVAGVVTLGFSWASFAVSLAMSALSIAFTPKPKKSGGSYDHGQGNSQQFRQAVTPRETVYGEVRKSGVIVNITTTDSNLYLHFFIALASHEVQEIGEAIVDDVSIADDMLDADGNVISGRYSGYMRIRKHLGTVAQSADSFAVTEIPDWTTDHKLTGIAYVYVRLKWSQNIYPSGVPNFSFWVKGKKLFDPRSATTYWSQNVPLFIRDYLTDSDLGMNVSDSFIDDTTCATAANEADEYVSVSNVAVNFTAVDTTTDFIVMEGSILKFMVGDKVRLSSGTVGGLSGGTDYYVIAYQRVGYCRIKLASSYANCIAGIAINLTSGTTGILTKIAEPRYHGGGVIKSGNEPAANLAEMFPSMAGTVTNSGGKWRIYTGTYRVPTVYFDEGDLVGAISVTTKISKQDRFNRIQGVYTAHLNNGNPSDFPMVKNDTYAAQDAQEILRSRDLPFTQRPHTAMRIAKSEMERNRQEIAFSAPFNLSAFKALIADNIYFSFARYGWTNKVFEVTSWKLTSQDNTPVIEMVCREMASSVYDWSSGEETSVDPAPNTNLPNIFDVPAVSGLSFDSTQIVSTGGDSIYKLILRWISVSDSFVSSGGQYEIQYKKHADADYTPSYFVNGEITSSEITSASAGTAYDIRIRAVNRLGVRSPWNYLLNVVTGSGGGVTSTEDWGSFGAGAATTENWGAFTGAVITTEDWGAFA